MKTSAAMLARVFALTVLGAGLGLHAACESGKQTRTPGDDQDQQAANLCTEYDTCDACIAGQERKGNSRGAAETECGAAVLGCWTTWDKPITCGGKEQQGPE